MFGQFLEYSVPAPDLRASLDFWLRLGFSEVRVNDIRPHGYTAVTDGQIVIGLHGAGLEEPALTFVRPDLARHARALADAGTEFEFLRLDDDQFNEVGLRTPEDHLVMLVEAPTFSVTDDDQAAPVMGRCTELTLASAAMEETRRFFEVAGFLATAAEEDDSVLLTTPGLSLSLRSGRPGAGLSLRFEPDGAWREELERRGVSGRPAGGEFVLVAPEGTRLVLAPAD